MVEDNTTKSQDWAAVLIKRADRLWSIHPRLKQFEKRLYRLCKVLDDEYAIVIKEIWKKNRAYLYDTDISVFLADLKKIIRNPKAESHLIYTIYYLVLAAQKVRNEFLLECNCSNRKKKETMQYDLLIPKLEATHFTLVCECTANALKHFKQATPHVSVANEKLFQQLETISESKQANDYPNAVELKERLIEILRKLRETTRHERQAKDRICIPTKKDAVNHYWEQASKDEEVILSSKNIYSAWSRREKHKEPMQAPHAWRITLMALVVRGKELVAYIENKKSQDQSVSELDSKTVNSGRNQ